MKLNDDALSLIMGRNCLPGLRFGEQISGLGVHRILNEIF